MANKALGIRLNPAEWAVLEAAAAKRGVGLSEYVRAVALSQAQEQLGKEKARELVAEVALQELRDDL